MFRRPSLMLDVDTPLKGLNTPKPFLKIAGQLFQGTHEHLIGTELIMEESRRISTTRKQPSRRSPHHHLQSNWVWWSQSHLTIHWSPWPPDSAFAPSPSIRFPPPKTCHPKRWRCDIGLVDLSNHEPSETSQLNRQLNRLLELRMVLPTSWWLQQKQPRTRMLKTNPLLSSVTWPELSQVILTLTLISPNHLSSSRSPLTHSHDQQSEDWRSNFCLMVSG